MVGRVRRGVPLIQTPPGSRFRFRHFINDSRACCSLDNPRRDGASLASETGVGLPSNFQSTLAPENSTSTHPTKDVMLFNDSRHDDAAPSRQDLLQRAAELGPPRLTWENIVLAPTDPILGAKMQPRVVERRARFRKVVKVALGTCLAFCVVATAATALSSSNPSSSKDSASSAAAKAHVPATGVVPVEKLDLVMRTKAPSHMTAANRPASVVKKRR